MKILYTNFHPGNGGGHTTYLTYLFRNLLISKVSVFIAAPKSSKLNQDLNQNYPERVFNIDFPSKLKEISSIVRNTKLLAKIISKCDIDIVHVNGNPDHKIVLLCKFFYRFNFLIVRTKHNSLPVKQNFFAKKLFVKYTDHLIVVSNYQYKQITDISLANKTSVIHNGVDLTHYKPMQKSSKLIKQFRISEGDLVLVSVAGTALHKGWYLLVEAVSRLDQSYIDKIKIIIAGNYPSEQVVEKYVNQLNLQNNVIFTGFINDVRNLISIADIGFVLSTGVETISFACREMMAMGVPVLVSDYTGLSENIINGRDGWVVNNNSIKEIEIFIKDVVNIDQAKFSGFAYQKAQNEFGLEKFLDKTINIYYSLV
jgi:L-malate glycosyltransferase